ncbi:hypothetical protein COO60DRAFT_1480176, partial [Scenedesmus sp. NREL 46B-D3]
MGVWLCCMLAGWSPQRFNTAPGRSTQCTAMSKPQREAAELEQRLEAAYKAQQPFLDIIEELQSLATVTRIRGADHLPGVRFRPSIAVSLGLVPGGRGKPAREGTDKIMVWTWLRATWPSREHRAINSVPGEAAQHRPWEISQSTSASMHLLLRLLPPVAARASFKGQWVNTIDSVDMRDRVPFPSGQRPAQDPAAPSWLVRATCWPASSRVLLRQSTGLPLSASLLALLQQQGGDASCF